MRREPPEPDQVGELSKPRRPREVRYSHEDDVVDGNVALAKPRHVAVVRYRPPHRHVEQRIQNLPQSIEEQDDAVLQKLRDVGLGQRDRPAESSRGGAHNSASSKTSEITSSNRGSAAVASAYWHVAPFVQIDPVEMPFYVGSVTVARLLELRLKPLPGMIPGFGRSRSHPVVELLDFFRRARGHVLGYPLPDFGVRGASFQSLYEPVFRDAQELEQPARVASPGNVIAQRSRKLGAPFVDGSRQKDDSPQLLVSASRYRLRQIHINHPVSELTSHRHDMTPRPACRPHNVVGEDLLIGPASGNLVQDEC